MADFSVEMKGKKNLIKKLNEIDNIKDQKKLLNLIGLAWVGLVKTNFKKSIDPFGSSWDGVNYIKYRGQGSKTERSSNPLLDTGRLVSSFSHNVKNGTLIVGTPVIYAKTHNEGLNGVKQRQFLPEQNNFINSSFERVAKQTLDKYIEKNFK